MFGFSDFLCLKARFSAMRRSVFCLLGVLAALLLAAGCASIGTPSGGPRDEDPPRFITATPEQGSVEVTPTKAVLTFNELVTLKDAFSKVVVSPPSATVPRVSSLGRRVTVEFRDTLLPNTTYTVDFGDAIADNNEGNKLENFIYTFSTGPVLDSLMVSGMVLGAEDLEPAKGVYVGLHTNLADSAFTKTRFDRVAKTDDKGRFVIGGLAPGQYRIFALEDKDGDMAWSSPEETLAFYDTLIEPASEQTVTTDTIFNLLTGAVDSIRQRSRTRFVPNNILLRHYNTGYKQQYIPKYERQDSTRLYFLLNAATDSMPRVEVVLSESESIPVEQIAVTEKSATNDTLTFWLKDRGIISRDTLRVAIRYFRADSAYNMVPVNDTLRMLTQRPRVRESKVDKQKDKKALSDTISAASLIEFKALASKVQVNEGITYELPSPLDTFDFSMVHLEVKEDTLWKPAGDFGPDRLRFDSLNPRRLRLDFPWDYATSYKVTIDSLAGRDIYGLFTDDFKQEFTIPEENEYSSLKLNLSNMGADSIPRFVDLLDSSGKIIRSLPLAEGSVTFEYLLPSKYNVRVVEDLNANGLWDPGVFELGIQPDVSYYYPETIELKQNWSQEIDWDVFSTPVDRQKPQALRKK